MNWLLSIDSAISGRICLTLLHSLWQVALLMIVAEAATRLLPRSTAQRSYAVFTLALMASLIAVPVTYRILPMESPVADFRTLATARPVIESANESAAILPVTQPVVTLASQSSASDTGAELAKPGVVDWMRFTPWLLGLYVLGVGVMLTRLVFGLVRDRRARRSVQLITSGPVFDHLQRLCRRWNLRGAPLLAQAEMFAVPKLLGIVRPVIVLPSAAMTGLTTGEVEMILAHELAHLRRGDMWINLLQRFAESVLFFNPAIWLLSRRISSLREYCCDDAACNATACRPAAYASLLIRLAESAVPNRWPGELTALAATGKRPSELRCRIARLLGEPIRQPVPLTSRGALVIASTLALLVVGPMVWPVHGQTDNKQAGATQENGPLPTGSMTRRFESGAVVELLGIGNHDVDDQQWWDDSGNRLSGVKFRWKDASTVRVSPAPAMTRSVAIRTHGRPKDAAFRRADGTIALFRPDYVTWRLKADGLGGSGSQILRWWGVEAPDDVLARYFTIADQQTKTFDVLCGNRRGALEADSVKLPNRALPRWGPGATRWSSRVDSRSAAVVR